MRSRVVVPHTELLHLGGSPRDAAAWGPSRGRRGPGTAVPCARPVLQARRLRSRGPLRPAEALLQIVLTDSFLGRGDSSGSERPAWRSGPGGRAGREGAWPWTGTALLRQPGGPKTTPLPGGISDSCSRSGFQKFLLSTSGIPASFIPFPSTNKVVTAPPVCGVWTSVGPPGKVLLHVLCAIFSGPPSQDRGGGAPSHRPGAEGWRSRPCSHLPGRG